MGDEEFARQLQREFDKQTAAEEEQEKKDAEFALELSTAEEYQEEFDEETDVDDEADNCSSSSEDSSSSSKELMDTHSKEDKMKDQNLHQVTKNEGEDEKLGRSLSEKDHRKNVDRRKDVELNKGTKSAESPTKRERERSSKSRKSNKGSHSSSTASEKGSPSVTKSQILSKSPSISSDSKNDSASISKLHGSSKKSLDLSSDAKKYSSSSKSDSSSKKASLLSNSKKDSSVSKSLDFSSDSKLQSSSKEKPLCQYGRDCYRRNPVHLQEFSHPNQQGQTAEGHTASGISSDDENAGMENHDRDQGQKVHHVERTNKRDPHGEDGQNKQKESHHKKHTEKQSKSGHKEDKEHDRKSKDRKEYKTKVDEEHKKGIKKHHAKSSNGQDEQDNQNNSHKRKATGGSEPPLKKSRDGEPSDDQSFSARLQRSAPYRMFLTKSISLPATHKDQLGVVLPDLLHPSLGTLVESAQFTFLLDLEFVHESYHGMGQAGLPVLLVYGELENTTNIKSWSSATLAKVRMPFAYGVHHSKMMLLRYKEGMRVVVHTSNMYPDDWFEKTQGVWVSPLFPFMDKVTEPAPLAGESPTHFRRDLVLYLESYKLAPVNRWAVAARKHDFSACNAVFVGHVPGYHRGLQKDKWGHMKLRGALAQKSTPLSPGTSSAAAAAGALFRPAASSGSSKWFDKNCCSIIQCSSIGSLGADCSTWLTTEFAQSLGGGKIDKPSNMHVVYPSEEDVRESSQGWGGGSCLPYNSKTHEKQPWLMRHMCNWRSTDRQRSTAMPHIKTYCRLNNTRTEAQYLLLTSANLSKAAWGALQKEGSQLFVRSYEAGVLLLPSFVTKSDSFFLQPDPSCPATPPLPLHYDIPLTPYTPDTRPWLKDTKKDSKDKFGESYP